MAKAPAKAGSSATPVQQTPRVVPPRVPPTQAFLPTQATGASASSPQPPEALANAGPGDVDAEPIATGVPGADPSTFLGKLHVGPPKCVIFGDGKPATPPVLRHDAGGSITLFWWHPLAQQWCWFDKAAVEWVGVSEQWGM